MKNVFKITVMLLINLVLITSCHKEELSTQPQEDNSKIEITRSSFNNFQQLPILIDKLMPKEVDAGLSERGIEQSLYDFEIDSTKITHISRNGTVFYTMGIFRGTSKAGIFENLIISDNGSEQHAYLIKYFPDTNYLNKYKIDIHTPYVGGVNFQEVDYSELLNRYVGIKVCIRYTQVYCNYGGEEHPAGLNCTAAYVYTKSFLTCFTSFVMADEPEYIVDLNIGQENGIGGGDGGAVPPEILTEPVLMYNIRPFISSLTQEQRVWWNNPVNANPTQDIINYLQQIQTEEAEEFAKNLIDEIKNNSINNDAWSDNIELFNTVGPEIIDIEDYLKCFDITQPATFTIYADQPTPNDNDSWAGNVTDPDVGHTFISIKQGNIRRVIGFYPASPVNPFTNPSSPSQLVNNSGHTYDASITTIITPSKLKSVLNYIKNHPTTYNLNSYNCIDFGISVGKIAGLIIPSAHGSWPGESGDNPGQLGQNLRNIPLPANSTRTTNTATAASNTGTCN